MRIVLSVFCYLAAVFAATAQAAIITYTDQAAWQAALSGSSFVDEAFQGPTSDFGANTTHAVGSQLTIDVIGGVGDTGPTGLTGALANGKSYFQGELDSSSRTTGDGLNLQFNFATPALGVALLGIQNNAITDPPGELNQEEIGFELLGERFLMTDILGLPRVYRPNGELDNIDTLDIVDFVGFVSSDPFASFKMIHGDQVVGAPGVNGQAEHFYVDSMLVAPTAVPLPPSLALMLAGLGVLVAVRRRTARGEGVN